MPLQSFNFSLFLFTYYAYAGTFGTYATLYFAARGLSVPQIGVLVSLIPVMRIVGPNLWGWAADRSRRRVLVLRLTALGATLAFGGIFFAHSYAQFFVVLLLVNLFASAQSPLCDALMLAEMRGDLSNYGKLRLWGSLGFIAAVMGAGYFLEWFGVEALLGFTFAILVLVFLASLRIRERAPAEATHKAPALWSVLRKPEVGAFFLSAALMCGAHMALYAFYSLYLERAGYSKPLIGAMWALGVVAEVAFFYFQSHVFGRFGARRVMLFAFGAALLRFAVTGAAPGLLWVMLAAQLLHSATFAAHHSASVLTMQRWFAGPLQASGQALYMSVAYGIGCTLGGLLLTFCWDRIGPQPMFYAAAGMAAAGAVFASLSFRLQARAACGQRA
jgi:PPP family 3-phenylpropionic acid transporter